jgi:two-component system sensor histidine kinase DegS
MRERVDLLQGKIHIDSKPGQGTKIQITVPIEAETLKESVE